MYIDSHDFAIFELNMTNSRFVFCCVLFVFLGFVFFFKYSFLFMNINIKDNWSICTKNLLFFFFFFLFYWSFFFCVPVKEKKIVIKRLSYVLCENVKDQECLPGNMYLILNFKSLYSCKNHFSLILLVFSSQSLSMQNKFYAICSQIWRILERVHNT